MGCAGAVEWSIVRNSCQYFYHGSGFPGSAFAAEICGVQMTSLLAPVRPIQRLTATGEFWYTKGMQTKIVFGQPSWKIATKNVEAYLTQTGGHLGPVTFKLGKRKIQPFSIAPWWNENLDKTNLDIIRVLRGDFFCMPFGGNGTAYKGEKHPVHGEVANAKWKLEQTGPGKLHASLRTKVRRGRVDKHVALRAGQTAIYQQHVVSEMTGPISLGHHAMLFFQSPGVISTSKFVHGQVFPGEFEKPAEGGYQSFKPGAEFTSLERIPQISGELADLTHYPARRGFEDLVTIVSDASVPFAWTAVTFPKERYVWFALKDPRVLRETVFWLSNGGRHMPHWSSRHVNVMGLEEITGYFHYGVAESAQDNAFKRRGYPTAVQLNPRQPTVINYIMAVAAIPAGFDKVASVEPIPGGVELRAESGKHVRAEVDVNFLQAVAP